MKKRLTEFKQKCELWKTENPGLNIVYNIDLDALEQPDIKYILVADNPGNEEKKLSRYLVGPAGIAARVYFERAIVKDFKKEVLVLNKTPIYSNVTDQLGKTNNDLFQKYMVETIIDLHQKLEVPIIISGYSNGITKKKDTFRLNNKSLHTFFSEFANAVKDNKIKEYYIVYHFSRNMFYSASSISDYEKKPEDILFIQGRKNREMFENGVCKI